MILLGGFFYVMEQKITIGELLFYAIVGYFTGPIGRLVGHVQIQNALIAADRLFEIMDLENEVKGQTNPLTKVQLGDIVFKAVSFRYGSRKEFSNSSPHVFHFARWLSWGRVVLGNCLVSLLQKLYHLTTDLFTTESSLHN